MTIQPLPTQPLPVQAFKRGMVHVPEHAPEMTPDEARVLAMELITWADAAEGWGGRNAFVTRWDMLMELENLQDEVARMRAEVAGMRAHVLRP